MLEDIKVVYKYITEKGSQFLSILSKISQTNLVQIWTCHFFAVQILVLSGSGSPPTDNILHIPPHRTIDFTASANLRCLHQGSLALFELLRMPSELCHAAPRGPCYRNFCPISPLQQTLLCIRYETWEL